MAKKKTGIKTIKDPVKIEKLSDSEERIAKEQEEAYLKMQVIKLRSLNRELNDRIIKQLTVDVKEKDDTQLNLRIPIWKLKNIGDNISYQMWIIERDLKNTYNFTYEQIEKAKKDESTRNL